MSLGRSIIITVVCLCAASTSAQTPGSGPSSRCKPRMTRTKGDFDCKFSTSISRGRQGRDVSRHINPTRLQQSARSMGAGRDGCGKRIAGCRHGRRVGAEIHIEQRSGVFSDRPSTWKIRYYDIQPDRFSWIADRSTDGGKTWQAKHQTIDSPNRTAPLARPARTREERCGSCAID